MTIPRVILVVEADDTLRKAISLLLRREGYMVLALADEALALQVARENLFSLVIVDLQHLSSTLLAFCQHLLTTCNASHMPLLAIMQNEREIAQMEQRGLHADDHLVSPFKWEELRACTQTLLRSEKRYTKPRPIRAGRHLKPEERQEQQEHFAIDDLVIDVACRTVVYENTPLEMGSAVLFDLLVYFARHPGVVITREHLLGQVWGYDDTKIQLLNVRTVDVHVHWLRELLGDTSTHPSPIQTIRGVGYRFKAREREEQ